MFPLYPYGAGNSRLRGSIESKGDFLLNDMWQFGWNGTWMSDKFFLNDYKLQGIDFSDYYFQDVVSSIYLRGQAAHSYFDLSAYRFRRHDAERRQSHPAHCRAGPRFQSRHRPSRRPHLWARRTAHSRYQRRQHRSHQCSVSIDRPADVRQRLPPLQCLRDAGRKRLRADLYPGQVPVARHSGRLRARLRPGLLAAQLYRFDRRSLEAVPFRASRRRIEPTQRDRIDHLRQLHRLEHGRQFEPGRLLLRFSTGLLRSRHGGRSASNTNFHLLTARRGARRQSRRSGSSSSGPTRSCPGSSPTRTRKVSSSTRRTCSHGTSFRATTGSKAARA